MLHQGMSAAKYKGNVQCSPLHNSHITSSEDTKSCHHTHKTALRMQPFDYMEKYCCFDLKR